MTVGGGIAASSLAKPIAGAGHRVLVVERDAEFRDRVRGELITPWGNDYPHHDSIWPNSMRILDDILEGVPYDERRLMKYQNTVEVNNVREAKPRQVVAA